MPRPASLLQDLPPDFDQQFAKPMTNIAYLECPVSPILKDDAESCKLIEGYGILAARLRTNLPTTASGIYQPRPTIPAFTRVTFLRCIPDNLLENYDAADPRHELVRARASCAHARLGSCATWARLQGGDCDELRKETEKEEDGVQNYDAADPRRELVRVRASCAHARLGSCATWARLQGGDCDELRKETEKEEDGVQNYAAADPRRELVKTATSSGNEKEKEEDGVQNYDAADPRRELVRARASCAHARLGSCATWARLRGDCDELKERGGERRGTGSSNAADPKHELSRACASRAHARLGSYATWARFLGGSCVTAEREGGRGGRDCPLHLLHEPTIRTQGKAAKEAVPKSSNKADALPDVSKMRNTRSQAKAAKEAVPEKPKPLNKTDAKVPHPDVPNLNGPAGPNISPHDADSKSKSYHLNILPGTIILVAGSRIFGMSHLIPSPPPPPHYANYEPASLQSPMGAFDLNGPRIPPSPEPPMEDRSAVAKQARMVKAEKHPFPMDTIVFGLFFMVPRAGLDLELRLQQGSN
ncbi:hypothetical protein D9611_015071 [Ephemerocybe angulata]|uniref:Uncharacterized protein n=1 Tax=Ephemerocybe angulata TaxID=980116 RepID=A0A8H5C4C1_9AGAR|nr:hypothetical protein D9611_015071 [Tulosesus angulatus]